MTLKYESEILFDLMKRDGVSSSSNVLPYESELKEKYLNQIIGAYPKLQDYRAEWLYYNLYHYIPFDLELVQGAHSYSEVGKKPEFNNTTTRVTNVIGNYIKVNPNTKITFSISNDIVFSIAEIDINGYGLVDTGWVIKSSHTITTKEKTSYIGFNFRKLDHSIITAQEVLDSNPMLQI